MLATSVYILWGVVKILRQLFFEKIAGDCRFDEKIVGGDELP
jgi:hypothetical protein